MVKELKSRYALDAITRKNPRAVEALIWIAILTLNASRHVHAVVVRRSTQHIRPRFTRLRWSGVFTERAGQLLTLALASNGNENAIEPSVAVHTSHALDPHVHRDRLPDGWVAQPMRHGGNSPDAGGGGIVLGASPGRCLDMAPRQTWAPSVP